MASSKPATEQPGNSFKYLYWRLSQGQFQQLCGALLRQKYPEMRCFPVGMADEGIDQIANGSIIFQVKWTSKFLQNPETWLDDAIAGERDKINRLIRDKRISRYILMTSVAGTTTAERTGSIQKLQKKLDGYIAEFQIPIECWWQSDIDGEVDGTPDAIKWSYQEMLAGSEAIRYLIHGSQIEGQAARMRDTLIQVMASQWREDSKVKFSQLDAPRANIVDLYVDVEVSLVEPPRNVREAFFSKSNHAMYEASGALAYMLRTTTPLTYLLGVPGQGKSTLGQYLSQVHRAVILPGDELEVRHPPAFDVSEPKLPLRIDLKDYAAWLSGDDPFGDDEPPARPRLRKKSLRGLEQFIADFCQFHSGGRQVTVEDVQSLLERYPTLMVLDGLDEVADPQLRSIIVEQINITCSRMGLVTKIRHFQVLVTARPNASALSEPDKDIFQTLRMKPLDATLQREYLNKWCDVNDVHGKYRRDLRRTFDNRTAYDHVAQLADNPMQLTILLFLIRARGEAVPVERTPLYREYLDALMTREVTRKQIAREQVPYVKEITAFLGWHMHSGVETAPAAGRMTRRDIETTLLIYFQRTEGPWQQVSELFNAATDRFWALSSKVEDTFEFAVQPLREYFAANFLAAWAGRNRSKALTKQEVLAHLVGRPYWLNTARFYAGFASPNELASLRYGLEAVVDRLQHPLQERTAVWALLGDGIFSEDVAVQRDVVGLLVDDLSAVLISQHPEAVANFPRLAHGSGAEQLAAKQLELIGSKPDNPLNRFRTAILRDKAGLSAEEFLSWWRPRFNAESDRAKRVGLLSVAGSFGVPRLLADDLGTLRADTATACRAALAANASPTPRSALDSDLLAGVLAGWCSDVPTISTCEAGALLRTMRPQWFQEPSPFSDEPSLGVPDHLVVADKDRSARSAAWRTLTDIDTRYAALQQSCRLGKGQQGTTEPWQKPAMVLKQLHGACWLAAEIAIAGAAKRSVLHSGTFVQGGEPFGPDVDYGTFVLQVHRRPGSEWWSSAFKRYSDPLSRRMWVLALMATAGTNVLVNHLESVDAVVNGLGEDDFFALAGSSSRLARNASRRRLAEGVWSHVDRVSERTLLLISHFAADLAASDPLPHLTDKQLTELASPMAACWPISRALANRMMATPNDILLLGLSNLVGEKSREPMSLDSDVLNDVILDDPAAYPASWVLQAEHRRSVETNDSTVETIAFSGDWVPAVPRLH